MSASDKKKLRKEQAAALLSEKQKKEQAEAKKLKAITISFVAIMLVVALTAASILGIRAVNNSGIIDKNTLAATTGAHNLNSVQMNYYLNDYMINTYSQWKESYGDSISMYMMMSGLDINKPLNQQVYDKETGKTWADQFLQEALAKAKSDYALYDKAIAEGFTLTEDEQSALDLSMKQLELSAMMYGYRNPNKYLCAIYGHGSTLKSYAEYTKISAIATAYYSKHSDSLSYDDAAIRAHEKEHPNDYTSYTYASYYLSASSFLQGGTTGENNTVTYSDEEKETARKTAEELANTLAASTDLDSLDKAIAALEINKDKKDAASTKNTSVLYPQILAAMQPWLSDAARVANDITVIPNESVSTDAEGKETKTINGYYVVLFESRDENLEPLANVRHLLVAFEGGTTSSDGSIVYSDEQKAAAKTEAERLLQVWKDGAATEESFIALVKEHTDDSGSKENGGLYEDITPASPFVPSFLTWSTDPDRKPGDTSVLISEYGYHVMYYVSDDEMNYRDYMISEELRTDDMEKWFTDITDAATITCVNTKRLNLDAVLANL